MQDEDQDARRMLAPLAGEPAGPSSVDIQRAIADGRRRVRTRRVAGVGVVAAVTALLAGGVPAAVAALRQPDSPVAVATATPSVTPSLSPAPFPVPTASPEPAPAPPTSCDLELLAVPASTVSWAFGADPTGQIVFGRYWEPAEGTRTQPVLWVGGELVPVDIPGEEADIQAVNSSGIAVATSKVRVQADKTRQAAWIYQDGVVTELAGEHASAHAITEDGVVLGQRLGAPVVWRSPQAPPEELPRPGYAGMTFMSELTPDGAAVGYRIPYNAGYEDRSSVWWPDGTVQDIPFPEFDGERSGFRARALNGHLLIGEAWIPVEDGPFANVVAAYDLTTGEYRKLSQDAPLAMTAMNRHGWVAGEADGHAGLWTPEGGLVPLPGAGEYHDYPHWISDDGRTVTGVVNVDERDRAAIWRCG